MKLLASSSILAAGLLLGQLASAATASSWTFSDASIQISQKGGEAAPKQPYDTTMIEPCPIPQLYKMKPLRDCYMLSDAFPCSFWPASPIADTLSLRTSDNLKILLTAKEDGKPKRPHQLFLLIKDSESELESLVAFDVKESGKARVDLTQKEIPTSLLSSPTLTLSIVIGSFGQSTPLSYTLGDVALTLDPALKKSLPSPPLKYGKLPEVHHIFRAEPRSPPVVISIVFLVGVLVCLPGLFGAWIFLGANASHLPKSLSASPIAHPVFFASLLAFEAIFFGYYIGINIFQTLAAVAILSPVALISGSRALREVRARRLNGER